MGKPGQQKVDHHRQPDHHDDGGMDVRKEFQPVRFEQPNRYLAVINFQMSHVVSCSLGWVSTFGVNFSPGVRPEGRDLAR
jgi:hypothetical protein